MSNVEFQENSSGHRPHPGQKKGALMKFLEKRGMSNEKAQQVLYGVIAVAFVLSLVFWIQLF